MDAAIDGDDGDNFEDGGSQRWIKKNMFLIEIQKKQVETCVLCFKLSASISLLENPYFRHAQIAGGRPLAGMLHYLTRCVLVPFPPFPSRSDLGCERNSVGCRLVRGLVKTPSWEKYKKKLFIPCFFVF